MQQAALQAAQGGTAAARCAVRQSECDCADHEDRCNACQKPATSHSEA